MNIKEVTLTTLLKLAVCEECQDSFKGKSNAGLMCRWENEKDKRCIKVKKCGHWPKYLCEEEKINR